MGLELITYSISDIGKVITGKTPPASIKSAYSALDGVPFVTPKDMDGRRWIENTERYLTSDGVAAVKRNLVPAMSVAVSCIGSDMGKAVLLKKESITNQQINSIVIDVKRFNPKYIYYVLSTKQQYFKDIAGGSATPILNKTDFGKITFQAPSKYYQDLIVEYLDCLDSKRELNRQINQTLEQMAQALFKSWFVDFDPVIDNALDAGFFEQDLALPDELLRRAEARRAVRERGDFKPLPDATRQLLPAAFEDGAEPSLGLGGWVPQGWKITMLDEITCELRRGVSPKYVEEGGVQVINQKCIRNHEVSYEPARRHNHEAKKIDGRELCIGDVLVNSTGVGTLGRIAQVNNLPETTVVDSHVTVVRVKDDVYPIYTFGQLMLSMEGKIERLGEGSTGQTELSRKILSEQLVILPPFDIAAQVEKTFKSFSEKQVSNRKQCATLTNLRDTLLPKLISGELRLDQIEADLAKEGMA